MKKTLITALAVVALASPFAASAQPNMQPPHQGQYQNRGDQHGNNDRGDQHRDRNGHRENWRDSRPNTHWDASQHNGYYIGNSWHYGPPPQNYRGRVTFGYHRWSAGQRLGYYNGRYRAVDYRTYHLRAPRRGYHWVRDDDGDFILAAIATGLIASVVLGNN